MDSAATIAARKQRFGALNLSDQQRVANSLLLELAADREEEVQILLADIKSLEAAVRSEKQLRIDQHTLDRREIERINHELYHVRDSAKNLAADLRRSHAQETQRLRSAHQHSILDAFTHQADLNDHIRGLHQRYKTEHRSTVERYESELTSARQELASSRTDAEQARVTLESIDSEREELQSQLANVSDRYTDLLRNHQSLKIAHVEARDDGVQLRLENIAAQQAISQIQDQCDTAKTKLLALQQLHEREVRILRLAIADAERRASDRTDQILGVIARHDAVQSQTGQRVESLERELNARLDDSTCALDQAQALIQSQQLEIDRLNLAKEEAAREKRELESQARTTAQEHRVTVNRLAETVRAAATHAICVETDSAGLRCQLAQQQDRHARTVAAFANHLLVQENVFDAAVDSLHVRLAAAIEGAEAAHCLAIKNHDSATQSARQSKDAAAFSLGLESIVTNQERQISALQRDTAKMTLALATHASAQQENTTAEIQALTDKLSEKEAAFSESRRSSADQLATIERLAGQLQTAATQIGLTEQALLDSRREVGELRSTLANATDDLALRIDQREALAVTEIEGLKQRITEKESSLLEAARASAIQRETIQRLTGQLQAANEQISATDWNCSQRKREFAELQNAFANATAAYASHFEEQDLWRARESRLFERQIELITKDAVEIRASSLALLNERDDLHAQVANLCRENIRLINEHAEEKLALNRQLKTTETEVDRIVRESKSASDLVENQRLSIVRIESEKERLQEVQDSQFNTLQKRLETLITEIANEETRRVELESELEELNRTKSARVTQLEEECQRLKEMLTKSTEESNRWMRKCKQARSSLEVSKRNLADAEAESRTLRKTFQAGRVRGERLKLRCLMEIDARDRRIQRLSEILVRVTAEFKKQSLLKNGGDSTGRKAA